MNVKKAKQILKKFEPYKIFPITWLSTDEKGEPSVMAIAEAYGFMQAVEKFSPLIKALKESETMAWHVWTIERDIALELYSRDVVGE